MNSILPGPSRLSFNSFHFQQFFQSYGLRAGILLGTFFTASGAWTRYLGVYWRRFPYFVIGQALAGIGQSCMVIVPSRLATVWFGESGSQPGGSHQNGPTARARACATLVVARELVRTI